ncbi:BON domain-containing protein [Planctomicrobium sp. SH661]|uniref:BON domain-containing protein n=1 Tax=Planctomicrobium sp. SH661 TaxID=3448124 RepID=UPI003F5CA0F4
MAHELFPEYAKDASTCASIHCAIDDPVPGDSESGIYGTLAATPHETECLVQRALLSLPNVQFSSLQVHRLADGICLTGVVKVAASAARPQFERVAGTAAGVAQVLNRLVIQQR